MPVILTDGGIERTIQPTSKNRKEIISRNIREKFTSTPENENKFSSFVPDVNAMKIPQPFFCLSCNAAVVGIKNEICARCVVKIENASRKYTLPQKITAGSLIILAICALAIAARLFGFI